MKDIIKVRGVFLIIAVLDQKAIKYSETFSFILF